MNKPSIITAFLATLFFSACSDVQRKPSRVYMPDMAYSRAYETYDQRDSLAFTSSTNDWEQNGHTKIFYNNQPVAGSVSRGETYVYHIAKDEVGDTANYVASIQTPNPLPPLDSLQMKEAQRIYLINCGICHGTKLDGNGPLWKDGAGPFPAAPKNLVTLNMADGQMFYSITYGKNLMGSYAGQVSPKQRWAIIHYIKAEQAKATASSTPKDTTIKK